MKETVRAIATLYGQFSISANELDMIADHFAEAMENGLQGMPSRLKMLPSFIDRPTGRETGEYLVLDFGGTNLRLLSVLLEGDRKAQILRQKSWPLRDAQSGVDLTAGSVSGEELFDSIAAAIGDFAPSGEWRLGHTFSFPCRQYSANRAELIHWTKEIRTAGVEGRDITSLLTDALRNRSLTRIQPVAVINDTVGTYLAAAYAGERIVAGAICGTGHNMAYLEPDARGQQMVINMESGDFDPGMGTVFDAALNQDSEKPGAQLLEKQVSGRYLGELFRLVLTSLHHADILRFDANRISKPYSLSTEIMGELLADDTSSLLRVEQLCRELLAVDTALEERRAIKTAALLIVTRSARLAAAALLGVLRRLDPPMTGRHVIAVDGSLYEKMPGYRDTIESVLVRHLPRTVARTCLVKDGSGIGAAVAAAICS